MRHYADAHDQAVWHTLLQLLGEAQDNALQKNKERAQLPCRLGGCGLRCSRRTAPAAYWAALADVLPTLQQRFPHWTGNLVQELEAGNEQRDCLKEALRAARRLRAEGFEPPSYEALMQEQDHRTPTLERLTLESGGTAGSTTQLPTWKHSTGIAQYLPPPPSPHKLSCGHKQAALLERT